MSHTKLSINLFSLDSMSGMIVVITFLGGGPESTIQNFQFNII